MILVKASTGNIELHMEQLDLVKLIKQTMAELEEPISNAPLVFKTAYPQQPAMIYADGQRLYRVFQNLVQNALQYSLEGSRVYVAVKLESGRAMVEVKNISKFEVPEGVDFSERFVRGDASRSDGGSGLGLSIARSFTEACGGAFAIGQRPTCSRFRSAFRCLRSTRRTRWRWSQLRRLHSRQSIYRCREGERRVFGAWNLWIIRIFPCRKTARRITGLSERFNKKDSICPLVLGNKNIAENFLRCFCLLRALRIMS